MAHSFKPNVLDLYTEAFERCGINPQTLTADHLRSAGVSLNMILLDLSTNMFNIWTIDDVEIPLILGQTTYTLPGGAMDLLSAVLRDDTGNDTPMAVYGQTDWLHIPTKDLQGRPDRYWVDRELQSGGTNDEAKVHVWLVPDRDDTYTLVGRVINYVDTPFDTGDQLATHRSWFEAVTMQLAAALALKFAMDRYELLALLAERATQDARRATAEYSPVSISLGKGSRRAISRRRR